VSLPPGWALLPLGNLLASPLVNGRSVPTRDGGFPVLRLTAIQNGRVDLRATKGGAWDAAEAAPFLVSEGDLLIVRGNGSLHLVGRGGLVGQVAEPVAFPDTLIRVRPNLQLVDPRFLNLALDSASVRSQIERNARTTAGIYKINQGHLVALAIPVPPLEEQRRIVALLDDHLSRLDAADQLLDASAKRAGTLLRTTLWGATHLPGETRSLSEIADVKLGRQRSPKNHSGADMVPYLRAANVGWNRLRLDDVKTMNFTAAERDTFTLRDGDILLTEASGSPGEVGKSVVYRGQPPGVCFQNTVLRLRCFDANPDFIQRYLLAEAYAGRFVAESRGVGIHHLGRTRLSSWPISLPPRHTQDAAVEAADEILGAVTKLESEIAVARKRGDGLKRALLANAFSGQLTSQRHDEATEEVA